MGDPGELRRLARRQEGLSRSGSCFRMAAVPDWSWSTRAARRRAGHFGILRCAWRPSGLRTHVHRERHGPERAARGDPQRRALAAAVWRRARRGWPHRHAWRRSARNHRRHAAGISSGCHSGSAVVAASSTEHRKPVTWRRRLARRRPNPGGPVAAPGAERRHRPRAAARA